MPYPPIALHIIENSSVPSLLREHAAVAVERLARGGGATRWFFVDGPAQLGTLVERLSPGSLLSFYFDNRIACTEFEAEVGAEILRFAQEDGDAVLGRLSADGLEIKVDLVSGEADLDEVATSIGSGERIFYGRFPRSDEESIHAVTLHLPDDDGVVRSHPH